MDKIKARKRRKKSIRKKVSGTSEMPRMCVHKSNRNLYVQLVDDINGKTLCGKSTQSLTAKDEKKSYTQKNLNFAGILGDQIAKVAIDKGITRVVFDRAGYRYHGVVKIIADTARKSGLKF